MDKKLFNKMRDAIRVLVNEEPTLECKLNFLTDIGLGTTVTETFMASEDVRGEVVDEDNLERIADDVW